MKFNHNLSQHMRDAIQYAFSIPHLFSLSPNTFSQPATSQNFPRPLYQYAYDASYVPT